MPAPEIIKRCSHCKETKPIPQFAGGKNTWCKECRSQAKKKTNPKIFKHTPQWFWSKVKKGSSCWEWMGPRDKRDPGYGTANIFGTTVFAHRLAYILTKGKIPCGLVIDHLCFNKNCVNPSHLEAVTSGENSRRYMLSRTHCVNGHPFDMFNTSKDSKGKRVCKECGRLRWHRRKFALPHLAKP